MKTKEDVQGVTIRPHQGIAYELFPANCRNASLLRLLRNIETYGTHTHSTSWSNSRNIKTVFPDPRQHTVDYSKMMMMMMMMMIQGTFASSEQQLSFKMFIGLTIQP
jgi:hypothetical protein